jgi:hypothetical protein
MVYWFLKIQKHVTLSILKIQRIISYHKPQNIEWLICWTFTKIRKILHPSENNTPVTICRNQESGIEKSFRRKTPCTHYSHKKGLKSGTRWSNSDLQCTHYFHTNKHIKRHYEKKLCICTFTQTSSGKLPLKYSCIKHWYSHQRP